MNYDRSRRSPNYWTPAYLQTIGVKREMRFIVIHSTEGAYPSDVEYLCDPQTGNDERRVSAHVYISRNPAHKPFLLVDEANAAWHAYVAPDKRTYRTDLWPLIEAATPGKAANVNYCSLSIELEARRGVAVTNDQWWKAIAVVSDWLDRYPTLQESRSCIIGHYELNKDKVDPLPWGWANFMDDLRVFRHSPPAPPEPAPAPTDARFFPETGKTVSGPFLHFFTEQGGIGRLGFPLTGVEDDPEVAGLKVVYFENARVEWRPDNPAYPRFGAVGRQYLKAVGRL